MNRDDLVMLYVPVDDQERPNGQVGGSWTWAFTAGAMPCCPLFKA